MSACGHMRSCYYKILGVTVRASQEEIKRSFRMLALRWHPDRNPQDPRAAEHFREALEAYETLVDPSRRGRYDKSRGYVKARTNRRQSSEAEREKTRHVYRDIMEGAFGYHSTHLADSRIGYDLRFDLQVLRSAIVEGIYENIEYRRAVYCPSCFGNGNGRRFPSQSCNECNGDGEIEENCSVRVWIPGGSEDGARLRLQGAGDCRIRGTVPGDLVILLHIVE
ncbi:MAG: DnaJ domain-containing protein [Syntrophobacteraceae bacterium]